MSLQHVPGAIERPDLITALRHAIAQADAHVGALADAGEWEALAHGLHALRPLKRDIDSLLRRAEDGLAESMPTKLVTDVEGLPPFERRRGTDRKKWRSEELLREIVLLHRDVDPETGEITVDLDSLLAALKAAVPFTGSLSWRITALRELGIEPGEWAETRPGRTTVQFHEEVEK